MPIFRLRTFLVIAGAVFAASLLGLLTRVEGSFAAFWPANPIVLGILIRHHRLNGLDFWGAAFAGYFIADVVTGNSLAISIWLSMANLAGVSTGYLVYLYLLDDDRSLRKPISMVWLFIVCTASAISSSLIGVGMASVMFGRSFLVGSTFWFTTELVNSIIFLPAILAAPTRVQVSQLLSQVGGLHWADSRRLSPAIALLLLMIISMLVNRPGAFAYPIPALLWCALSFSLFTTALLTLLYSVWAMTAISAGLLPFLTGDDPLMSIMSQRLAIALIALGPLVVASINSMKDELLKRLEHAANYDFLTDALARRALLISADSLLKRTRGTEQFFCVLMLDIDNFKSVNDLHGHAAGDRVLVAFADQMRRQLLDEHLFGRMGGEEFAIVFDIANPLQAQTFAERIRSKVEQLSVRCTEGAKLKITVSGGLAISPHTRETTLDELILAADKCLYRAKHGGKNRIVLESPNESTSRANRSS